MTSPYLAYEYATSAARIAATFTRNDIGGRVLDYENGNIYTIIAAGTGASVMRRDVQGASILHTIVIPLDSLLEVDANGDVSAIAGNGGKLASDTTPILRGNAAETFEVVWVAGNADPVSLSISLPVGFDGTRDVFVDLVGASGTTNAFAFTVETGWDGGALVSDTATGSASATVHTATATVAAADVADAPNRLTLALTPATHAADAFSLQAIRIRHYFA